MGLRLNTCLIYEKWMDFNNSMNISVIGIGFTSRLSTATGNFIRLSMNFKRPNKRMRSLTDFKNWVKNTNPDLCFDTLFSHCTFFLTFSFRSMCSKRNDQFTPGVQAYFLTSCSSLFYKCDILDIDLVIRLCS